jgi:tetratricopeptide (TPR) repeat protein
MPESAAPWHERAADRAMRLRAHDEALAHLALAGESATVEAARGEVLIRLGRYDEAIAALEAALATHALDASATAATLHRLADVHDRLGEWALAQEHLRAAEDALGTSTGPLWARLRTDQALSNYRLGELEQARALAEEVTSEESDPAEQARAWNLLGMVAGAEGDPESGLAAFTRSVEMAARTDAAEVTVAAWHNQSRALHLLGRIDEAQEAAERARALAEQEADLHRIAVVESNLADILHAQGRTDDARALQARSAKALAQVALPLQRPEVWLIADW